MFKIFLIYFFCWLPTVWEFYYVVVRYYVVLTQLEDTGNKIPEYSKCLSIKCMIINLVANTRSPWTLFHPKRGNILIMITLVALSILPVAERDDITVGHDGPTAALQGINQGMKLNHQNLTLLWAPLLSSEKRWSKCWRNTNKGRNKFEGEPIPNSPGTIKGGWTTANLAINQRPVGFTARQTACLVVTDDK